MKNKIVSLILFLCHVASLAAQTAQRSTIYDEDWGMNLWHLTKMMQDKKGFMWFSTWNGLARFDGYEFVTFKTFAGDGCPVTNDRIRDIEPAPAGGIYCLFDDRWFLFSPSTGRFSTLSAAEQASLKRAKDKLEWSARLYKEKYLSESDYRTDELSCKRYELELKSAENALNLLKDYTYKRQMAQLKSDVEQAEMALERIRRKANADITQATATLNARELELRRQNEQVEKLREQISNCRVLAPADGLVIYATSSQGPFRRQNQEPLDVGTEVYQRQDIIYLPEGDDFKAEIKVHETNLKKIYLGLPVRVTVDALKGVEFSGRITKVAPLPDAQSLFMNPDLKLYNAEVAIDDARGLLKSGMNCRADIIVEQHEDIAYVPIQCVVREGGKPVVYRRAATPGGADEAVPVEIGLDNNQVVIVRSGLEAGQEVSLTPPLDKADKPETRAAADPKLKIPPRPADGKAAAPNGGGQPRFRGPRPNGGAMRRPGGGEGQGGRPRGPRPEGQGGAQPQRQ